MDWLTIGSYGLTFASGILTKVLADWWTDSRRGRKERATTNERFTRIEVAMPAFLQEIRADLSESSLVREFVVLPSSGNVFNSESSGNVFNSDTKRFVYHEEAHADLGGKIAMLTNSGYISNVAAAGRHPIYRMTEEVGTAA